MSSCIGEGCTHPDHNGQQAVDVFNPFVNPAKPVQFPAPAVIRCWQARSWIPFGLFRVVMKRCNRAKQSWLRSLLRFLVAYDVDRDLSRRIRLWLGKRKAKSLLVRWWNNDLPEIKENL
jgi:hypothetical protein